MSIFYTSRHSIIFSSPFFVYVWSWRTRRYPLTLPANLASEAARSDTPMPVHLVSFIDNCYLATVQKELAFWRYMQFNALQYMLEKYAKPLTPLYLFDK